MTALALLTELTEVHIVAHVTSAAFGCQLYFTGRAFVTTGTLELAVRAGQRKLGGLVVIEFPDAPTIRRMTTGAVLTQATLMTVLRLMAAVAIALGVFELLCEMTLFARHRDMQTQQREVGEIVIEANVAAPTVGHMALIALRTELTYMNVLCAMTAAATRC